MTDFAKLADEFAADLESADFLKLGEKSDRHCEKQVIDNAIISHDSQFLTGKTDIYEEFNINEFFEMRGTDEIKVGAYSRVEGIESGEKCEKLGNDGVSGCNEERIFSHSSFSLEKEIEKLRNSEPPSASAHDPAPIPAAEVRALFDRVTEAMGGAPATSITALVAGFLRKDPRLSPPQTNDRTCLICGRREARDAVFIAVLAPRPRERFWMHSGCHRRHVEIISERVAACLAAAKF